MSVTCPTCGAQNDEASRFCDQCGATLPSDGAPAAPTPAESLAVCPNCGAAVLPGEAFCDECGTELKPATAASSADAPTILAAAGAAAQADAAAFPAGDATTTTVPPSVSGICPRCGHNNIPGDRFCDQCGADLETTLAAPEAAAVLEPAETPLTSPTATSSDAPTELAAVSGPPAGSDTAANPSVMEPADEALAPTVVASAGSMGTAVAPDAAAVAPDAPDAASAQQTQTGAAAPRADGTTAPVTTEAPPIEPAAELPPAAAQPAASSSAAYEAERQRLEGTIATQQQLIAQFEQMLTAFGAAAPPAVSQGLAEAQASLAEAEASLAALVPPPPPVDPAEVKRLEDEIALQQRLVAQFEQMLATFGPAAPPAVSQGLGDARTALVEAEAKLAALGTGAGAESAPTTVAATPATTPAAEAAPAPAPAAEEGGPATAAVLEAVPVDAPPAAAAPVAEPATTSVAAEPTAAAPSSSPTPPLRPRLVVDDGGAELLLDPDRQVFIIGREDPISGIHPEVDVTPYGGEGGGVSRQHARIERDGDQWTITDLDSTNYTRVDGTRLEPNVATPISDGARLQFGRLVLVFKLG